MAEEWSHEWIVERVSEKCPEMGHEITSIISRRNIRLAADVARDDLYFGANPKTGTIRFSVQPIARLWARVYAYLLNYERMTEQHGVDPRAILLVCWTRFEDIAALRSRRSAKKREPAPYPERLPLPFIGATTDILVTLAEHCTVRNILGAYRRIFVETCVRIVAILFNSIATGPGRTRDPQPR